jgi:hypothetical protein
MKLRNRRQAFAVLALGAIYAAQSPAYADDTATEIRLLKAQLKRLEEKVNEQSRKQKETQVEIRKVGRYPGPVTKSGLAEIPEGATPLFVTAHSQVKFGGLTITPGGFFALETVYRSRFVSADIGTPFQNIPYQNVRSGLANEFRFSARQSRLSLLAQGDVNPATHLAGYVEMDFLGAAQTANSNESNSYNPRIRHLYATVDQDDFGVHVLAGQTWSLATTNGSGIVPRTEVTPATIDAQYVPGFIWARQPGIRVVKDFDKTLWFALSAENPQTTVGGFTTTGTTAATLPSSLTYNASAVGGGLFNTANAYSLTSIPDFIGKAAWDPTFADRHVHFEAFGMFRNFYDQGNCPGYAVTI